jgi:branched-chain amino acid transport system ATP-binding protein
VAERVRLGMGISHQIVRPFRNITLVENVMLAIGHPQTVSPARALLSFKYGESRKQALELLRLVAIDHVARELPGTQPLGVLKRLEVARTLAMRPRLLFLDEPLAGLGPVEAARMADLLQELNRNGTTIVLIEHNLSEAQRICGRFVVLDNGYKIADGPVAEVLADDRVISAYLGERWRDSGVA